MGTMQSCDTRVVTLRGGLTVPLAPVLLLLDLEERGLSIRRDGDDLIIRPRAHLTPADLAALRHHKPHVLALVAYVEQAGEQ